MTVLSKKDILKLIRKGKIVISPFSESQVGPASIDLRLGEYFRVFRKGKTANIVEGTDYKDFTKLVKKDFIILKPNEFVLGVTKEKITLPADVCGWLTGRSRFARLGLSIHITASFIQPGISNKQVLEMKNVSSIPLRLIPGTKVCQIILMKASGKNKYEGKFANQISV
ncbi:MAG: dCTP deaminase [Nanoarchaeota archaeon]|nr:dCTP deaminase [Nanoarchaeota archaeon]